MAKKPSLAYTLDNLRGAVSLNGDPVSLQALARAFDIKERHLSDLRSDLQKLVDEGSIFREKYDRYYPKDPISTLVVARVNRSLTGRDSVIYLGNDTILPLSIEGLPDEFPFPVTVTGKILKKKFGKSTIYATEQFAVVLGRRHASELIVTRVIDRFKFNRPPTIVGHFKARAGGPIFVPYTPGLNKTFNAHGKIPEKINPKISYLAKIPLDLDPYAPSLEIAEQKWDPDTGIPIASIIANKHGIHPHHTKKAMLEARQATRLQTPFAGRRDLLDEKILIIDPVNARDNDDGIMIERTRDGYRTLVVVADVPYYVRPGSELDRQARAKGFTHYFPDDTFHMLPHRLVQHASLKEGRSKPVIYAEQFWDEDYNKIGVAEVGAGVIASQKQLSYGQMEDLVIARSPEIASYLELGDSLVERMRFEKVTFDVDDRNRRYSYSEMLVSALMIEANTAFAAHLLERNAPFLSRSHTGSDNVFAFNELKMKLEDWGYDIPDHISAMDNEGLRQIIAQSEARNDKRRVEGAIRADFLNQAIYSTLPYGHFGLNRENYTHATSPIRRYADILTLRSVHDTLGNYELGLSEDDIATMEETAQAMNVLQDVTRRVNLDVQKYYAIRDLQRLEGCPVKAMLGKIDPFHVEIILDQKYGLRKRLDISTLPERWSIGRNGKTLIFNDNVSFSVGNHVRIKIGNVRPHMGDWDIHSMEPTSLKPKLPAVKPLVVTL